MVGDEEIEARKQGLRDEALKRRAQLNASERTALSSSACAHLHELLGANGSGPTALYWPIRDEIDVKPAMVRLVDEGHAVMLPVVLGEQLGLQFRLWQPGEQLFEAGFGTLAPGEMAPRPQPRTVVIPLLGYDSAGTRLGYGKGYYDRTLAAMRDKPLVVGFAFGVQKLDHIPAEPHDVPMDWIVTEAGARKTLS